MLNAPILLRNCFSTPFSKNLFFLSLSLSLLAKHSTIQLTSNFGHTIMRNSTPITRTFERGEVTNLITIVF